SCPAHKLPNRRVRTRTHGDVSGTAGDCLPIALSASRLNCSLKRTLVRNGSVTCQFSRILIGPGSYELQQLEDLLLTVRGCSRTCGRIPRKRVFSGLAVRALDSSKRRERSRR